jgi:hypothetical protein
MLALALNVLGRGVRVHCADDTAAALLSATYGAMQGDAGTIDLEYSVRRGAGATTGFVIERTGGVPLPAPDKAMLLAEFDADLAIQIQRLRPDLYVVHAAVLARGRGAVMLVARSGGGKSTLSWALLHHGFDYLSDELAPIELASLDILPFPRALMVKRAPPASHPITPRALRTTRGFHVPVAALPSAIVSRPAPLRAIFFLDYSPEHRRPSVRPMTAAEGAARLYANTLNSLAHTGQGLDGAIRITGARPCFLLMTAELGPSCELLATTLDGAA